MTTETITLPSPLLFKHTEVKPLLTDRMKKLHPTFRFLTAATGVYHFQRVREFGDYDLKEALHFVFSLRDYSLRVSVSSILNPVHNLTPVYNNGLINPHADLVAIVNNDSIFPSPATAYLHDGTIEGINPIIDQAIADFTTHGLPFLERRWNTLRASALVRTGMEIIDLWEFDKTMLRNELNVQFRKAKQIVANLRHPVCNQLKEQLAAIPGQPPEHHQEIPRLAFELMELYCNSRIIP
jgi:hypothetical protein